MGFNMEIACGQRSLNRFWVVVCTHSIVFPDSFCCRPTPWFRISKACTGRIRLRLLAACKRSYIRRYLVPKVFIERLQIAGRLRHTNANNKYFLKYRKEIIFECVLKFHFWKPTLYFEWSLNLAFYAACVDTILLMVFRLQKQHKLDSLPV